ncbi:MAG: hypothetical protein LBB76_06170, partial [Azoarcus sp.]|nr:hypothetical protein [Azoarcus sp.]
RHGTDDQKQCQHDRETGSEQCLEFRVSHLESPLRCYVLQGPGNGTSLQPVGNHGQYCIHGVDTGSLVAKIGICHTKTMTIDDFQII